MAVVLFAGLGCSRFESERAGGSQVALHEDEIAHAVLEGTVHGNVAIVSDTKGRMRATLDLAGPPNRASSVYLVKSDNCDEVRQRNDGKNNNPWKSIGSVTLDEAGKNESKLAFGGVDPKQIDEYAIAIELKVATKQKPKASIISCGTLSLAQQTALSSARGRVHAEE